MAGGDWVRKFFGLAIALSSFCMGGAFAANSPSKRMTLQELSPLASADQIAARLLTPVTQDRIHKFREKASVGLREQVIMAGEEPFEIYVPEPDAAGRFGLLVFFWPADEIQVPAEWWKVFRDRNTIYVAARKSGNVENIYDRRVPLALHVYEHARRHYHLDPERVYIGGFSGGSRTAQRVAMGYPDVFRGALLIGGSDVVGGESGFTLPAENLVQLLQQRTRFVFATGGEDSNRAKDAKTRRNLESLCMQGVRHLPQSAVGHWVPSGSGLARVMRELDKPVVPVEGAGRCDHVLRSSIDMGLADVSDRISDGDLAGAGTVLANLDALYGGLAAPRSVQLAERIAEKAGLYELARP